MSNVYLPLGRRPRGWLGAYVTLDNMLYSPHNIPLTEASKWEPDEHPLPVQGHLQCYCNGNCHESASSTVTNLWTPLPKPEENQMPIESRCHCLKPKCLPVPTILLTQNIIENNVHNLGLLETIIADCLLPTHQWLANCLKAFSDVWPALNRIIIVVILWILCCNNILIPLSLLYQTLPNKSKPSHPFGAWHSQ